MRNFTLLNCLLFSSLVVGQPSATEESEIIKAYQIKNQLIQNSRVKNVNFKNIGPTIMSGRVVALEVNPDDPTEFYVAYASGGVWHTINNGTSFNPISEEWIEVRKTRRVLRGERAERARDHCAEDMQVQLQRYMRLPLAWNSGPSPVRAPPVRHAIAPRRSGSAGWTGRLGMRSARS